MNGDKQRDVVFSMTSHDVTYTLLKCQYPRSSSAETKEANMCWMIYVWDNVDRELCKLDF